MSRTKPTPIEQAQLAVVCHTCKADVSEWCRSGIDQFGHDLHVNRYWRIWPIVRPLVEDYEQRLAAL
jgi:hypothetical protein